MLSLDVALLRNDGHVLVKFTRLVQSLPARHNAMGLPSFESEFSVKSTELLKLRLSALQCSYLEFAVDLLGLLQE